MVATRNTPEGGGPPLVEINPSAEQNRVEEGRERIRAQEGQNKEASASPESGEGSSEEAVEEARAAAEEAAGDDGPKRKTVREAVETTFGAAAGAGQVGGFFATYMTTPARWLGGKMRDGIRWILKKSDPIISWGLDRVNDLLDFFMPGTKKNDK